MSNALCPAIVGSLGAPNFGDEAILLTWLEYYFREFDCRHFHLHCISKTVVRRVIGADYRFILTLCDQAFWAVHERRKEGMTPDDIVDSLTSAETDVFNEIKNSLQQCSHLHFIGGGYITTRDSELCLVIEIIRRIADDIGIPTIFTGVSLGFEDRGSKEIPRIFRRNDFVDVRDDSDLTILDVAASQRSFDDSCLASSIFAPPQRRMKSNYGCLCFPGSVIEQASGTVAAQYIRLISEILRILVETSRCERVFVVDCSFWDKDHLIVRPIVEHYHDLIEAVVPLELSMSHPSVLCKMLSESAFNISGRLHPSLFSGFYAAPTMCLLTSPKIEAIARILPNVYIHDVHKDAPMATPAFDCIGKALERATLHKEEAIEAVVGARRIKIDFLLDFLSGVANR